MALPHLDFGLLVSTMVREKCQCFKAAHSGNFLWQSWETSTGGWATLNPGPSQRSAVVELDTAAVAPRPQLDGNRRWRQHR